MNTDHIILHCQIIVMHYALNIIINLGFVSYIELLEQNQLNNVYMKYEYEI